MEWTPGRIRLFRETGLNQSQETLAKTLGFAKRTLSNAERGVHPPSLALRRALDHALENASDLQRSRFVAVDRGGAAAVLDGSVHESVHDGDNDALELARRVAASDVGQETVNRLERTVEDLATRYPVTPPAELLADVRRQLRYVMRLVDARATLRERQRLLVAAGWLSLLTATLYIDLKEHTTAAEWLVTAASLAQETEHTEILAWRYETEAWQALTDPLTADDYQRAVTLSQTAQRVAPRGGSAVIQATAQEGRAWARLGAARDTYSAINRLARLVAPLSRPDRPEHHYRYDPDKEVAFTATTFAWLGDPAAEAYAREAIARLGGTQDASRWPRRIAAAQIDLALALLASDQPAKAAAVALDAMVSAPGVWKPSNRWRALEVVTAVESLDLPEAADLREAYELLGRCGGAR